MFKNRSIVVTIDKKDKEAPHEAADPKEFEAKADMILQKLEQLGMKLFLGVCAYVILDTCRRVAVEQSKTNHQ